MADVPDVDRFVRDIYEVLNRMELDRIPEFADPDIEFVSATARIEGESGVFRGYEGLREYASLMAELWDEARWDVDAVEQIGEDRALVILHFSGRGGRSGVEIEQEVGAVIATRNGRAIRFEGFPSAAEARRAVGL